MVILQIFERADNIILCKSIILFFCLWKIAIWWDVRCDFKGVKTSRFRLGQFQCYLHIVSYRWRTSQYRELSSETWVFCSYDMTCLISGKGFNYLLLSCKRLPVIFDGMKQVSPDILSSLGMNISFSHRCTQLIMLLQLIGLFITFTTSPPQGGK